MRVLSKEDVLYTADICLAEIKKGEIFIYPTDTIYGIGCNAKDDAAVGKIRELKARKTAPFSIIAPSKEWILKNCRVSEKERTWVQKLPGPLTLILELKNNKAVSHAVNPEGKTLGVRIPNHWIHTVVEKLGFPVITTSANKAGQDFMTSLENLHHDFKAQVPIVIYEGEKNGQPSQVVDLTGKKEKVVRK